MIHDSLPAEHEDLKAWLSLISQNVIRNDDTEMKVWGGEKILSTIVQWCRRIIMLDQLKKLIEDYKQ